MKGVGRGMPPGRVAERARVASLARRERLEDRLVVAGGTRHLEESDPAGVRGVGVSGAHLQRAGPGTLLWSEASNQDWQAKSASGTPPRHDAFGWTNAFALRRHETITMHYDGGMLRSLVLVLEIAAWVVAGAVWVIGHRRVTGSIELQL